MHSHQINYGNAFHTQTALDGDIFHLEVSIIVRAAFELIYLTGISRGKYPRYCSS